MARDTPVLSSRMVPKRLASISCRSFQLRSRKPISRAYGSNWASNGPVGSADVGIAIGSFQDVRNRKFYGRRPDDRRLVSLPDRRAVAAQHGLRWRSGAGDPALRGIVAR